jgi:lactoylglutathione lyase
MPGVTSLTHIALRAKNLQRTIDFYTNKLGFKEIMRLNWQDGNVWLVYLRVTDTQYIEIFPDGVGDRATNKEATGFNHFCLQVEGIESVVDDLASRGVVIMRELREGPDGNRQAWIEDPDGTRIELMEMKHDCIQFEAVRRLEKGLAPVVVQTNRMPEPAPAA